MLKKMKMLMVSAIMGLFAKTALATPYSVIMSSGSQTISGTKTFQDYLIATGVVGIGGNTAPSYPLDITGAFHATGQGIVGGTMTVLGSGLGVGNKPLGNLALRVYNSNALGSNPPPSGTTAAGIFQYDDGTSISLAGGTNNTSPYGFWLQSSDFTGYNQHYPLLLNPIGGSVAFGTLSAAAQTGVVDIENLSFQVGTSTLVAIGGKVGVGIASPQSTLDVGGSASFGSTTRSTFTSGGSLQLPSGANIAFVSTKSYSSNFVVAVPAVDPTGTSNSFIFGNFVNPSQFTFLGRVVALDLNSTQGVTGSTGVFTSTITALSFSGDASGLTGMMAVSSLSATALRTNFTGAPPRFTSVNPILGLTSYGGGGYTDLNFTNTGIAGVVDFGRDNDSGNGFFSSGGTASSPFWSALGVTQPMLIGHGKPEISIAGGGTVSFNYGTIATTGTFTSTLTVQGSSFSVGGAANFSVMNSSVGIGVVGGSGSNPLEIGYTNSASGMITGGIYSHNTSSIGVTGAAFTNIVGGQGGLLFAGIEGNTGNNILSEDVAGDLLITGLTSGSGIRIGKRGLLTTGRAAISITGTVGNSEVGINVSTPAASLHIVSTTSIGGTEVLRVDNNTGTKIWTVTQAGNVVSNGSVTTNGSFFGDGSNLTGVAGVYTSSVAAPTLQLYGTTSTTFQTCASTLTITTHGYPVEATFSGSIGDDGAASNNLLSLSVMQDGVLVNNGYPIITSRAYNAIATDVPAASFSYLIPAVGAGSHSYCITAKDSGGATFGFDVGGSRSQFRVKEVR